ncbi:MAG: hypothetical protein CMP83_06670 [Gammaproteobacteria bacterium]|nr:hypothetical protein [Gammaproteobacteria bacterium]
MLLLPQGREVVVVVVIIVVVIVVVQGGRELGHHGDRAAVAVDHLLQRVLCTPQVGSVAAGEQELDGHRQVVHHIKLDDVRLGQHLHHILLRRARVTPARIGEVAARAEWIDHDGGHADAARVALHDHELKILSPDRLLLSPSLQQQHGKAVVRVRFADGLGRKIDDADPPVELLARLRSQPVHQAGPGVDLQLLLLARGVVVIIICDVCHRPLFCSLLGRGLLGRGLLGRVGRRVPHGSLVGARHAAIENQLLWVVMTCKSLWSVLNSSDAPWRAPVTEPHAHTRLVPGPWPSNTKSHLQSQSQTCPCTPWWA